MLDRAKEPLDEDLGLPLSSRRSANTEAPQAREATIREAGVA
jgi:hypothetical protein